MDLRRLTILTLAVVLAVLSVLITRGHSQPPPCTPYLLCPYPSGGTGGTGATGGTGGVSGAGTGGRGGSGGRGGTGGSGGAGGQPSDGLVVTAALSLDRRVVRVGSTLTVSVTYGNTGKAPITVPEIRVAGRAPGASHAGGPYSDFSPALPNVTIAAGGTVRLNASRNFLAGDSPLGEWEAYATHKDTAGKWHDQPSENFQVVGAKPPTPPTGKMSVGTQEWFVAPWAGTHLYKPDVNWATAYESGADIWNPQFLTELAGYSVFRHMDTNAVNWSKISRWSQRKLPNDPANEEIYIDGASPASTTGLAVEWQIDLCNRAGIDCWFTHPYLADDDYIVQQANLIHRKLSPSLRAYIELSNEVWNGSFSAFQQSIDAGTALGLPGDNQYYQGIAHEMYRALQMFEIYQSIFGDGAMGQRVIRVFSESGNLDLTTQALRNVYDSSQWNPRGQKIDMIALAPYIGNGVNGASETLSRWKAEVDQKVSGEPINIALTQHVQPYNIPLLGCYEAGMHHLTNADIWAKNSQAYDAYLYMLDKFGTKMNAPCALYTLHGTWESKGAWGLYNNVGQQLAQAPKARGTRDWMSGTRDTTAHTRMVWIIVIVVLYAVLVVIVMIILKRGSWKRRKPPTQPPPPPHNPWPPNGSKPTDDDDEPPTTPRAAS